MEISETLTGYKVEGSIDEIVDFCEYITDVVDDNGGDEEKINNIRDWMPNKNEDYEDMKKKTAEHNSPNTKYIDDFEYFIYKNVMSKISPCYFDNKLFNAKFEKSDHNTYILEININDDSVRAKVEDDMKPKDI